MDAAESPAVRREGKRAEGEGALTARVMTAAKDSPTPLSQQEIDRLLGVEPREHSA